MKKWLSRAFWLALVLGGFGWMFIPAYIPLLFTSIPSAASLQAACDQGDRKACTRVAIHQLRELGGSEHDPKAANEAFRRLCKQGEGLACRYLGVSYREGISVAKDEKQTFRYLQRSCHLGQARGCLDLAHFYRDHSEGQNFNKMVILYERARGWGETHCNKGDGYGCFAAGWVYDRAPGMRGIHDQNKAYKFYKKGCSLDHAVSCTNYGVLLERRGMNFVARQAYRKSCKLGYGKACRNYAYTTRGIWSYGKTQGYVDKLEKGCRLYNGTACWALGWLYDTGKHPLVAKDLETAARFYEKGCHFGEGRGCHNLGMMWYRARLGHKDIDRAMAFFKQGCARRIPISCVKIGDIFQRGLGRPQDCRKATQLYQRACRLNMRRACTMRCRPKRPKPNPL